MDIHDHEGVHGQHEEYYFLTNEPLQVSNEVSAS